MSNGKKIKIDSFIYEQGGQKFAANATNKEVRLSEGFVDEENCPCGSQICHNGKVWRCMPLDDEGTCIWFVTNENC